MKNILFVPFNLLSHISRCVTVAKYLDNLFNTYSLISKSYENFVARHKVKYYVYKEEEEYETLRNIQSFNFSWINYKNIFQEFSKLFSIIKEIKPDLVISDSNIFVSLVCEYLELPHISLMNSYMTNYFLDRYTDLNYLNRSIRIFLRILSKFISVEKMSDMMKKGEQIYLKKFHRPFRIFRGKYGLKMKNNLFEEFEGDEVFLLDPKEIFPISGNSKVKIIGPIYYHSDSVEDESFVINTEENDKPNILITLGSSGDIRKFLFLERLNLTKFYNVVILGESSFQLNISGAQKIKFANISKLSNYIDVVICHGGNGTVYSFLSKGVPSIMIPSHIEQYWFSYQIHKKGFGILYNPKMDIIEKINELIQIRKEGLLKDKSEIFDIKRSLENLRIYISEFANKI